MSYTLLGIVGLLLLIIAGVFYCVLTLWTIKEDLYVPDEEIDRDFPDMEAGE